MCEVSCEQQLHEEADEKRADENVVEVWHLHILHILHIHVFYTDPLKSASFPDSKTLTIIYESVVIWPF